MLRVLVQVGGAVFIVAALAAWASAAEDSGEQAASSDDAESEAAVIAMEDDEGEVAEAPTVDLIPDEAASHDMEDVVVTATRSTTSKLNTTVAVDAIRRTDLDESMSGNVGEAVEQTPGVSLNSPAGGYFTNPNIRGLGGRRVIMLINGRRIDTEKTMGVTGYFISMHDVDRIEVIRGPASVLYGSDALGGVIHVISPDALKLDGLDLGYRLQVNSNDSAIEQHLGVGWGNGLFGFKLSVAAREADNYTTGNGETIENSFYQDRVLALRLAYKPHPKHTLRLLGDAYFGVDIGKAVNDADQEKYRRVRFPHDRHYMAMFSYEGVDLADRFLKLHFSGYFDYTDRHQNMAFFTEDYSRQVTDKNKHGDFISFGSTLYSVFNFWKGNDLTLGGDYWHKMLKMTETTQAVIPGIETPITQVKPFDGAQQFGGGVFLQDEQYFGENWILSGGIRWDGIENRYPKEDNETQTDFDQAISGNIGVLYHPIPSMSLTLNGGRAFRSPTLKEKFVEIASCKGDLCGNPDVLPESSWNIDAGLKGYWSFLTYEFYFFNVFITDYITLEASDREQCQFEYTNIGEAWLIGGEGRLTFDFEHLYKSLGVKFWTSASYVRGEDRTSGDPLPQVPPFKGQAGIRLYGSSKPALKRFYLELVGRYNAEQRRVAPASESSPDVEKVTGQYLLADASLGFRFMPFEPGVFVSTFLKVTNIADTGYRDHLSTIDGMGRSIKLGLAVHY